MSKILIVDDEADICLALAKLVEREGWQPVSAHDGRTALQAIRSVWPDVVVLDWRLPDLDGIEVMRQAKALDPDLPVILITAYAEIRGAVQAMRTGALDYLTKPFDHSEVIRVVRQALAERELKLKLKNLPAHLPQPGSVREILGPSGSVSQLIADINRVAQSNFSVVILGETGSGKELVARAIHQASSRARGPFVPVDCGAIPETLIESELFGHERGAFTGAHAQEPGKLEAAHGGTVFLDEISNMPLGSQAKLLRALQERVIFRIGATKPIGMDARVLAASNCDLHGLTESSGFRRDLYFRLNEFTIRVPPLRERREDLLFLAKRFLDITNLELKKIVRGLSEPAVEALLAYDWPGNVRQLRSTMRRAVLLADDLITAEHLDIMPAVFRGAPAPSDAPQPALAGLPLRELVRRSTMKVERDVIAQTLRCTGGNKARAARMLQIDYKTMHSKVKEYGISHQGEL
jgi:DNA-binding NtrC family response regulator